MGSWLSRADVRALRRRLEPVFGDHLSPKAQRVSEARVRYTNIDDRAFIELVAETLGAFVGSGRMVVEEPRRGGRPRLADRRLIASVTNEHIAYLDRAAKANGLVGRSAALR